MAIDFTNGDERARLQRAIRYHWEETRDQRDRRRRLVDIFRGRPSYPYTDPYSNVDGRDTDTLVNTFQAFVKGQQLAVAYRGPRFQANARTQNGRGFDKRVESFLNRYTEILNFKRLVRQWSEDLAFGYAVAKVVVGIAPKGVHSGVAPRVYRLNPDHVILDQSASDPEEASFVADVYLVPLKEAREYYGVDDLEPWRETSGTKMSPDKVSDDDAFSEEQTRLIDVYFPTLGQLVTWPSNNDHFSEVGTEVPLEVRESPVNPYVFGAVLRLPDSLEQIAQLESLKPLHFLANDMLVKAAKQARASKRNPIDQIGNEQDLHTLINAGDNEPIFVQDKSQMDLWTLPGPDSAIINLGSVALALFSQYGGNLEVALGQSAGADTARQTQSLISQISARQSLDRAEFEVFLTEIAQRLATLAFLDETLELESLEQIPGTQFVVNNGWAPPHLLPRQGLISDYSIEIVPYSTAFRSPEERLDQLQKASTLVMNWMMVAAQGAPINIGAVIESVGQSFDLVPELTEWWSGEQPTPAERTANTYSSLAPQGDGSDIRSQGNGGGGSADPLGGVAPPAGGLAGALQQGGV